ncbi:MAG: ATP-binding protein [Rickettsiales bacterium]
MSAEKASTAEVPPTPSQPQEPPHQDIPTQIKKPFSPDQKYEYLTEYGTQILCLLTKESGCSYLSRNFESLTENIPEACAGNAFFEIIHPDFRPRLQELLAEKSIQKTKPAAFRCKLKHGDGKWYWYLFLIHGKHEDNGDEIVCVMENIHENIQTQRTLQRAKLEAELALRARSEFLANMSHDLRTPLNAVLGFAQLMEKEMFGELNPQYKEYTKHIRQSGYDLLTKIEDLLEISKLEAGHVSLECDEVALSDLFKNAIEGQLHHASAANVTVTAKPASQDLLLFVDRVKLQHILGHLVTNGIKHCEPGGKVELAAEQTSRGELWIKVSDNGNGIAKDKLMSIRAALSGDDSWSAKCNNNTGLGLALTKEFTTLHGGRVFVDSKVGSGTAIILSFPAGCIRSSSEKDNVYLLATAQ